MSPCKLQASQCPSIGSTPHQPRNVSFPKVPFGKSKVILRSFSSTWFDKWGWLHWDESSQGLFALHVSVHVNRIDFDLLMLMLHSFPGGFKIGKMPPLLFEPMRLALVTRKLLNKL